MPPEQVWVGAVALGGQGRYAAARAALRPLRHTPDPVVRSLAASTEASLWRQLGWHALASGHDGRALAQLDGRLLNGRQLDGTRAVEALADALIGLAADSIGTGRLERGLQLLTRCERVLGPTSPWRPRIRLQWVHAEIALAQGRLEDATVHAESATSLSRTCPSVRHAVKSELLLAAAHLASGRRDPAIVSVRSVFARAENHGLTPLAWAASMLGTALAEGWANGARDRYSLTIRQRGGVFRSE